MAGCFWGGWARFIWHNINIIKREKRENTTIYITLKNGGVQIMVPVESMVGQQGSGAGVVVSEKDYCRWLDYDL